LLHDERRTGVSGVELDPSTSACDDLVDAFQAQPARRVYPR
jgi:hypothetical protein